MHLRPQLAMAAGGSIRPIGHGRKAETSYGDVFRRVCIEKIEQSASIYPEAIAISRRIKPTPARARNAWELAGAGEAAPRDDDPASFALESEAGVSWSSVADRTVLGCPGVDGKRNTVHPGR
ncbi:hypothetical protein PAHAL_6G286100 [Panicum hallii]|uniref:Uncharacterized protein n=1 Tax=Panicum hallii TaxID=206008 RepID=A0A2T8II07_9POAL|nr:hypothetical protein PAHAL_6G286100 [Panicum hallii]